MTPSMEMFKAPIGATLPIALPIRRSDLGPFFAAAGFTRGAEIGVWEGGYAETLCAPNPGLELICVDPWQTMPDYKEGKNDAKRMRSAYDIARSRLAPYNCRFMKMTSAGAAAQIPDGCLDFIYIDANHLYEHVINDLNLWVPKVRADGVVSGHDYSSRSKDKSFIQVKPAVDKYTADHGISPWFILSGDKTASFAWVVR